ncbi:hypothetical protein [Lichenibacterium ramalinae]|uniref:hypothetical protein n=1 Tax=Lichenibacterium ramalinae TaxID=2316527 RepID=UPI001A92D9E6|nr:hypothetical protein [Lichenibacterium ramalinae]
MNALRLVFLVLAAGVLGIVGWRSVVPGPEPRPAAPKPLALLRGAMQSPAPGAVASLPMPADPAPVPQPAPVPVAPAPSLEAAAPAPAATSSPAATPSPVEAPAEALLAQVPEFSGFYDRLRTDFPRDYGALVKRLDHGSAPPPRATAAIWEALRDLEQSQGVLAAEADPPALDRFFDARSAVLEGLAPLNARQCVDFLYGMADASLADFTEAHRGLVATLADRTLDAITDGRGQHRDRAAPTAADLNGLTAGLAARGLSPAEIGLLIDGTTPETPLPDARLCDIGRTYLAVLHGLPGDARARIYGLAALLLARS